MRQSNFPKAPRSVTKSDTRKFYHSTFFRTATFFSLLALALVSLAVTRYTINTAQAQQSSNTVFEAASSFDASQAAAAKQSDKSEIKQPDVDTSIKSVEPTNLGGSNCGWTAGTVYPIPVLDNAVTAVGNNLYSFAGVSTAIVATSFKFDGTTWTSIAPLPVALEYPAAVSDGTSAYILGGVNTTTRNTLYRYDPATNDYTTLAPSAAATSTWNHGAVYLNGKIYKIAGYNVTGGITTAISTVEVYDIASNTWSTAANYPLALGFVSAFTQGGFIYGAGGTGTALNTISDKTFRYDPATNTWDDAAIADLPAQRFGNATANYNDGVVLAGGFVGEVPSNSVIRWNPTSNVWTDLPNMLQARARMNGAVVGGAFWVIGGRSSAGGFAGTNDNQKLSLIGACAIGSVTYISENGTPANNTPDPGETVTVSLDLQNAGSAASGNVTATLQATGGIVPVTATQTYGVLAPGGAATSRNFTFTVPANAVCGSQVTLTFTVTDGTTTTTITRTYTLGILGPPGAPINFSNTTAITINDNAPATPYPSDIAVSGLTPTNYNIKLTLNDLTHTFPGDVDMLLVGPGGQKFVVLSDLGGAGDVNAIDLTLSDAATATLSTTQLVTGEFKPGNSDTTSDVFPAPAPAAPYNNPAPAGTATFASTFGTTGTALNGTWSLYVRDDAAVDVGQIAGGWTLTFQVAPVQVCSTVGGGTVKSRADFDGDGKTDVSVFRNGVWYAQRSTAGFVAVQFGAAGDQIVPGDYDGDNRTDFAIFRPSATIGVADFYVLNNATNTLTTAEWGSVGDIARPGDFNGDNKADFAVYRPGNNTFYISPSDNSGSSAFSIGTAGSTPVTFDYDGDTRTDVAVWNPSTGIWTIRQSSTGTVVAVQFGSTGDLLVPADYDGDNKEDIAVFRNGQWIALLSQTSTAVFINFGAAGDVPVPGDYDGDNKDDQAVYRNGVWYILGSTSGFSATSFGTATDKPVPAGYLP